MDMRSSSFDCGNPIDVNSSDFLPTSSAKETPQEDLGHWLGFDRTDKMQSGGLFILSSQEECRKASTATRIGHAVLGAVKVAAAVAFVATGAWLVAQTFTGLTAIPALAVTCWVALIFQSPLPVVAAAVYGGSPTIFLGVLLKSAYHDFKLSATGKA